MNPNILFIMTDQHMLKTIGAYGSEICKTPYLDELAKDALVFDNAYTVCPICTPARASVQTGLYPFKHGMITNVYTRGCIVHELQDNEQLLSRRLQKQNYQVGYTGKWHMGAGRDRSILGGTEYPELVGTQAYSGLPSDVGYYGDDFKGHGGIGEGYSEFREYLMNKGIEYRLNVFCDTYPKTAEIISGEEGTVPRFLTTQTIQHIEHFLEQDKPFFYMLNHWQPHEPYHVPTKYLDMYRQVDIPEWITFDEDTSNKPFIHNVQRGSSKGDWEISKEFVKYYFAAVTQVDEEIGRVIKYLKDKGIYDETVIIFSADHGETLGVHNQLADKGLNMYEETTHIPLIIKGVKGFERKGQRESRLVNTCDFYSTVLELSGIERKLAQRDGLSLIPLLTGDQVDWREVTVTESSGIDNISYTQRMIRYKDIKFVFHASDIDELYMLDQDPYEINNLATNPHYFELAKQMRALLKEWMIKNGDGLLIRYDHLVEAKNKKFNLKRVENEAF